MIPVWTWWWLSFVQNTTVNIVNDFLRVILMINDTTLISNFLTVAASLPPSKPLSPCDPTEENGGLATLAWYEDREECPA